MSSDPSSNMHQRATGAILVNALKSPQFLFTLAFTAALYFLVGDSVAVPGWQDWFWLVGGGVAALGFLVSNVFDPQAAEDAVNKMFVQQLNLDQVKNRVARGYIQRALEYRTQMLSLAQKAKGALRTNLTQTVDDVNTWINHMVDLARHLDEFAENELVARDLKDVPLRITKVRQRIDVEARKSNNDSVVAELERQLKTMQQQLDNLQAATNNAKRAEIQLESALASLGTMYAQMSRLGSNDVDSSRAQRLRVEIQDEVASLQDVILAMEEVQAQALQMR